MRARKSKTSAALANVRVGTHPELKPDIARGRKSAPKQASTLRGPSRETFARWIGANATRNPIMTRTVFQCHRVQLVLQIADVVYADDVVAGIADWFIASDVRLTQDVGLSEIAFALRNNRDGSTLWVENSAYRP